MSFNRLSGTVPEQLLEGAENLNTVLKVGLAHNRLDGEVPGALARFLHMDLELEGNRFTGMAELLCASDDWMSGLVGAYGYVWETLLLPSSMLDKLTDFLIYVFFYVFALSGAMPSFAHLELVEDDNGTMMPLVSHVSAFTKVRVEPLPTGWVKSAATQNFRWTRAMNKGWSK